MKIRLCLVAVKCFPENTYFPEMLISGKGKYFSVFGCISKNFPENIFRCLEKKKENTNPSKVPSTIVIWDRDLAGAISRSTARDRDLDLFRSVLLCVDRTSLVRGLEIWNMDRSGSFTWNVDRSLNSLFLSMLLCVDRSSLCCCVCVCFVFRFSLLSVLLCVRVTRKWIEVKMRT